MRPQPRANVSIASTLQGELTLVRAQQSQCQVGDTQRELRPFWQGMRGKSTEHPVPTKIGVAVVRIRLNIGARGPGKPLHGIVGSEPRLSEPMRLDRL